MSAALQSVLLAGRSEMPPVLGEADLEALARAGTTWSVEPGTVVGSAGQMVESVMVVKSGELQFVARNSNGRRAAVALAHAGRPIADIPLLLGQPMMLDVIARRRSVLIVLQRELWSSLMSSSPSLAIRWMASVAKRLDADRRRLMVLTTSDLTGQVAFLLLEQIQANGEANITHSTLAELLGARRQSITRVLADLRDRRIIATRYGGIDVLDLPALQELVGSKQLGVGDGTPINVADIHRA